jgi:hypothetical protein
VSGVQGGGAKSPARLPPKNASDRCPVPAAAGDGGAAEHVTGGLALLGRVIDVHRRQVARLLLGDAEPQTAVEPGHLVERGGMPMYGISGTDQHAERPSTKGTERRACRTDSPGRLCRASVHAAHPRRHSRSSKRSTTRGPPSGRRDAPPRREPKPSGSSGMALHPNPPVRLHTSDRPPDRSCGGLPRKVQGCGEGKVREWPIPDPAHGLGSSLRHDDQRYRRAAGQVDRDRTDHPVGGVRGAAGQDSHRFTRVGVADGGGRCDQLIGDDALAPFKLPGCPAGVQLPGGLGAKLPLDLVKVSSISAIAVADSMTRLDRCATHTTSMRPVRPCRKRTASSSARLAGEEPSHPATRFRNPVGGVAEVTKG